MRNLKKVLALVLSLVMALSLVTVVGAVDSVEKSYGDANTIGIDYMEAAEVMNGLGIFQGDGTNFNPKQTFTREQLAGLMYRIVANDPPDEDKKDNSAVWSGYANYPDVPADKWSAGYIGYCTLKGYVKGDSDGNFYPGRAVTGYEVIVAMMHLAGYTELEGEHWLATVATATELGVIFDMADYKTLSQTATRQGVCDMAFQILSQVKTVEYNKNTGKFVEVTGSKAGTLGETKFNLSKSDSLSSADPWKAPAVSWKQGSTDIGDPTPVKVTKQYTGKTTHKAIATDLKLGAEDVEFTVFVNGTEQTDKIKLNKDSSDTKSVGGNGSIVNVYYEDGIVARIVVIDEYLAKVTKVDGTKLNLTVYNTEAGTDVEVYDSEAVTYEKGDMLVVKAAGDGDKYKAGADGKAVKAKDQNLIIMGEADYVIAKQTSPVVKDGAVTKRTVDGKTYENQATITGNTDDQTSKYYWYFGSTGKYILGAAEYTEDGAVTTETKYGVITSISAALDATTNGADVTVMFADGTTDTIKVKSFNESSGGANTQVTTSNAKALAPLYDTTAANAMTENTTDYLSIYPVADINKTKDTNGVYVSSVKNKGINLYKFESNKKGGYDAYEVTGDGTPADDEEVASFKGLYSDNATTNKRTLYKEYGRLTLTNKTVTVDNNTKIIVKNASKGTLKIYNGLKELTGDATVSSTLTEVDWVVETGKTAASVVVFTGEVDLGNSAPVYTYGLFYFTGTTADLSTDKDDNTLYTLNGYLNGSSKKLVFGEAEGKYVLESVSKYAAHLFAVEIDEDGESASLLTRSGNRYLLPAANSEQLVNSITGFALGAKNGNPYSYNASGIQTNIVYHEKSVAADSDFYNKTAKTLTLDDDTYHLDNAVNPTGKLDKLEGKEANKNKTYNITIVYDVVSDQNMVRELYIVEKASASSGSSASGGTLSELKISDLPENPVRVLLGTDENVYARSIKAELTMGNDVLAIGGMTSTTESITVPKDRHLVIHGDVTSATITVAAGGRLTVFGAYTTTSSNTALSGTIVAGAITLAAETVTINSGAVIVVDKDTSCASSTGDLSVAGDLENNGTISVAGEIYGGGTGKTITNKGTVVTKAIGDNGGSANAIAWDEQSPNTLTASDDVKVASLTMAGNVIVKSLTITASSSAGLTITDGKLSVTNGDLTIGTGADTTTVSVTKGSIELAGAGKKITGGTGVTMTIQGGGSVTAPALEALASVTVGDSGSSRTAGALKVATLGDGNNATTVTVNGKGTLTVDVDGKVDTGVIVAAGEANATVKLGGGVDLTGNAALKEKYGDENGNVSLDGVDLKANKNGALVDPTDSVTKDNDFVFDACWFKNVNELKAYVKSVVPAATDDAIVAVIGDENWTEAQSPVLFLCANLGAAVEAETTLTYSVKNAGGTEASVFEFFEDGAVASSLTKKAESGKQLIVVALAHCAEDNFTESETTDSFLWNENTAGKTYTVECATDEDTARSAKATFTIPALPET